MTIQDERLWSCDSCTRQERAPRIHSIEHVEAPDGWMRAVLLMKTGDPVTQWWCRDCVAKIAEALPNALGALGPLPQRCDFIVPFFGRCIQKRGHGGVGHIVGDEPQVKWEGTDEVVGTVESVEVTDKGVEAIINIPGKTPEHSFCLWCQAPIKKIGVGEAAVWIHTDAAYIARQHDAKPFELPREERREPMRQAIHKAFVTMGLITAAKLADYEQETYDRMLDQAADNVLDLIER